MTENLQGKNKKDKILFTIIGILGAILITLFVFYMIEKKENNENMMALNEEKEILTQELSELSHHYDELKTDNDTLNAKLEIEQEKITAMMDRMKEFRNNSYAEINKLKREIGTLKDIMRSYVVQIDSLNQLNIKLATENQQYKQQVDNVRNRNQILEKERSQMAQTLEKAGALNVENFRVVCINKKDKEVKYNKCFQLRADFALTKNVTAKRGPRMIYMTIMRPDETIIAATDKAIFKYQNANVPYTARREVEYEGEKLEVAIYWPNDGSLTKGKYIATLFCDNQQIGQHEFILN